MYRQCNMFEFDAGKTSNAKEKFLSVFEVYKNEFSSKIYSFLQVKRNRLAFEEYDMQRNNTAI